MATEEQLKRWHEMLRPFAVAQLARMLWAGVAEQEADEVMSRVLMRWHHHPEEVPADDTRRRAYVRRACTNWTLDRQRKANRTISLEALGVHDGEAWPDAAESVLREGYAKLTGGPQRVETAVLPGEESRYARLLRDELDTLARLEVWRLRSAGDLRYWLIWLLDLRIGVSSAVYGEVQESELFAERVARRVIWHVEEEQGHISASRPQLGAVWTALVPVLQAQGEASPAEISGAFGRLGSVVEHNTYEKWRQRMHERLGRACEELGVTAGEMMRRLLALLRPEEV